MTYSASLWLELTIAHRFLYASFNISMMSSEMLIEEIDGYSIFADTAIMTAGRLVKLNDPALVTFARTFVSRRCNHSAPPLVRNQLATTLAQ